LDRLAKDLLRQPLRVHISGIEEIDSGFEANIDETGRFRDISLPPRLEKLGSSAEGAGTEA
jgi:hypothetical protein